MQVFLFEFWDSKKWGYLHGITTCMINNLIYYREGKTGRYRETQESPPTLCIQVVLASPSSGILKTSEKVLFSLTGRSWPREKLFHMYLHKTEISHPGCDPGGHSCFFFFFFCSNRQIYSIKCFKESMKKINFIKKGKMISLSQSGREFPL